MVRKHAHTQQRLCERFATPIIGTVTCQDITTGHMQQIVNAAPTPGEGIRTAGMICGIALSLRQSGAQARADPDRSPPSPSEPRSSLMRSEQAGEPQVGVRPRQMRIQVVACG